MIFLDDIPCIGDNFETCKRNITKTEKLFRFLGLRINKEKSTMVSNIRCKSVDLIIE